MIPWPTEESSVVATQHCRVGVVTVNWNTRDFLARLVFGVQRLLPRGTVVEVVVVDNGSSDGSEELAQRLADRTFPQTELHG